MLLIGIAGGSGSGKTTIVNKLIEALPGDSVSVISQDAYYWDNGSLSPEAKKDINFDHPNSIEWDLLVKHIDMLKEGKTIQMPIYTYVTCARSKETISVRPAEVVIVEGILIFTCPELVNRLDIKIFVDADSDDRLMRNIRRDIMERGRSVNDVLRHYEMFVKPMHQQFIEPTKRIADLIIPGGFNPGGFNKVATDLMASRIKMQLDQMMRTVE